MVDVEGVESPYGLDRAPCRRRFLEFEMEASVVCQVEMSEELAGRC